MVEVGTEQDVAELAHTSYSRSLVEQLDLVPPDADAYLVVRDLRPLIDQARRVEQVMAGPLTRALPALAKLGGGDGRQRMEQLRSARELLALILAGLESSGADLSQGLVVVQGGGGPPTVLFAAADLERLGTLAGLAGLEADVASSCAKLAEAEDWLACSFGGAEGLAAYQPAGQGEALARRLADRMGDSVDLERINVAVSVARGEGGSSSFDASLRTDPGLWELSAPLPLPPDAEVLSSGPAPALRALVPGTSFVWLRVDPSLLAGPAPDIGPVGPELLSGEMWFGVTDDPHGFTVQLGITDASEAAKSLAAMARLLPSDSLEPEQLPGLTFDLDRASIDLDGERVPSIGLSLSGEAADEWAATLGVDPRARVWAHGDYLSAALGEVQSIPASLGRLTGTGPSKAAIAAMPPTLARALIAGEAGLVVHVVLDDWQAPATAAELESLLAGLPGAAGVDPRRVSSLFQALAPWSILDLWLRRSGDRWIAKLSLVPFAGQGEGISTTELSAAASALDAVLAGEDAREAYSELLAEHHDSARAFSYRARAGQGPPHHGAAGMLELAAIASVAVPAFTTYVDRSKGQRAATRTKQILDAGLALVESKGCEAVVGRAALGHPVWAGLGETAGEYEYSFTGRRDGDGCHLRVRARGDLDGDGVSSIYEREATIGPEGSRVLAPLRVDRPGE